MTQQTNWKRLIPSCLHQRACARRRYGDRRHQAALIGAVCSGHGRCLSSAVETGDPASGRSTLILKASAGCVVPWHFHTAEEQLIIVSGTVLAEMIHYPSARLGPGGFAVMGGRMPHQFTCQGKSACLMFVTFDRAYDIYWGKGS
jgi:quercetin dioxygenase-like cupin family protein